MQNFTRALIGTALLAAGGCVSWPQDTAGYHAEPYDPYAAAYDRRHSSFGYGLYYGRPFYTTYGAYPPGYYYDPRFLGVVRPPAPAPVTPPPAEPPPVEAPVTQPVPPRDWTPPPRRQPPAQPPPRPQPPAQPQHRAVPQAVPARPTMPAARPAPRAAPDRDDAGRRSHRTMPR